MIKTIKTISLLLILASSLNLKKLYCATTATTNANIANVSIVRNSNTKINYAIQYEDKNNTKVCGVVNKKSIKEKPQKTEFDKENTAIKEVTITIKNPVRVCFNANKK